MKILLCQISPKTGALEENSQIIINYYSQAEKAAADICIFPELSLSGYLAEDLFLNTAFIKDVKQYIDNIVKMTGNTCLLIPTPRLNNGLLYNAVIAARNGKIIGETYKQELPNYGVFDENRYFAKGEPLIFSIDGFKFGVPICEDIWKSSVCNKLKEFGAELFIAINASPFEEGKMQKRISCVEEIFKKTEIPIIYCNQIASQDGIIFDGKSFCFDGELNIIGKAFEETVQMIEFSGKKFSASYLYNNPSNKYDDIYKAMVIGTKSYVRENRFKKVILGLSGGVDSAMVAAIAVDALGADNVSAIMLPSKFTSDESIRDANEMAKILNISLKTIDIDNIVDSFALLINEGIKTEGSSIMHQNLQSRTRGVILMAESNKTGALLLTTGNKSEYATGYATIYGDMNGAFNPIKDIYKTDLYELARYKNIIPDNIMSKAPTAELSANQKDSDSLPEYEILDKILKQHIEFYQGRKELSKNFEPALVEKILKLVKNSEFKRRQSAPGVKISSRNFEKDRRYPITNHYGG